MKRLALAALLAMMLGSSSGCCIIDRIFHCPCGRWRGGGCYDGCDSCGGGDGSAGFHGSGCCDGCEGGEAGPGPYYGGDPGMGHGGCATCAGRGRGVPGADPYASQGPPGPPVGQVAYPYYTTRGPRDFLARNPGGIGP